MTTLSPQKNFQFNVIGKFAKKLPDRLINAMRETEVPWGPIGYVVYKRTYSRRLFPDDENSPKEELWQTLTRCINGLLDIGGAFTLRELDLLAEYLINLRCMFSGRHLWQLGTPTVERLGGDSLQACWHVKVNEPIHPFTFAFEELMLGGGVGFNIMPENVFELPKVLHTPEIRRVSNYDCDYIVPDNREGWVDLLRRGLESHFFTGKSLYYNTDCVRERGKPIRSFGGTASGSEDLVTGIDLIVKILQSRHRQKLRPIDCMDIGNIIGMIVVAGNVRRSAEIMCGSGRDRDFLLAKYWGNGQVIPRWRQHSNNTVIESNLKNLLPEFWWGYEAGTDGSALGEPYGLFNDYLAANYGRLIDGFQEGINGNVSGPNPCGEICLEANEACNLGELILTNMRNTTEFHVGAELMTKVLKTISCLPFLNDRTNEVVRRNHRLGLGITGVTAAHNLRKPEIFNSVYKHIVETDIEYSQLLGVDPSIARTTVKPSGTLSTLPLGCPPGGNVAYSQFCIRRISFAADSPMLPTLRESGYPIEPKLNLDGSRDYNTVVVSFPISYPDGTPDEKTSAINQLEMMKFLQTYWSDNSVSSTVQFRQSEVPEIKEWLDENYTESIKSLAFCRHEEHGFKQPPFEAITREQYNEFASKVKPIRSFEKDQDSDSIDNLECRDGYCPVK